MPGCSLLAGGLFCTSLALLEACHFPAPASQARDDVFQALIIFDASTLAWLVDSHDPPVAHLVDWYGTGQLVGCQILVGLMIADDHNQAFAG